MILCFFICVCMCVYTYVYVYAYIKIGQHSGVEISGLNDSC